MKRNSLVNFRFASRSPLSDLLFYLVDVKQGCSAYTKILNNLHTLSHAHSRNPTPILTPTLTLVCNPMKDRSEDFNTFIGLLGLSRMTTLKIKYNL